MRDGAWQGTGAEQERLRAAILTAVEGRVGECGGLGGFTDARLLGLRKVGFLASALIGWESIGERAPVCLPNAAFHSVEIVERGLDHPS